VEDVCDSIAILDAGRLKQTGKVSELLAIRDQLEIRLHADQSQTASLKELLKSSGTEVISVRNPTLTLEEIFVKAITPRSSPSGRDENKG
jgi:ABC-type multidrug transport system ATPase subunit